MSNTHSFSGVTPAVLAQMRATNGSDFAFDLQGDGSTGTVKSKTAFGDVEVRYEYAAERAELKLTILRKPMLTPTPLLLAEFSQAIREATMDLKSAGSGNGRATRQGT